MLSNNDFLFIAWLIVCYGLILLAPGKISKHAYSRIIAGIFFGSCLAIITFHETVIDVSLSSPIHGALLVLAQVGTLTLTSKLWLTINYHQLTRSVRIATCLFLYSALLAIIIGSYWLYKLMPELQILLYPFSSLAISLTAQILEDRWS